MTHTGIWIFFIISHARIQEFLPGGGSRPDCQKTALTTFFFILNFFDSFTVVYKWFVSKKPIIFQGFRGGPPTFSRGGGGGGWGGPTFSRGGGV